MDKLEAEKALVLDPQERFAGKGVF